MPAPSKYRVTPDELALSLLESKTVTVDIETGAIWRKGERAETLHKATGYGRVSVGYRPLRWAMAHRIVWLAAFGFIPGHLEVNHRNLHRWDNRLENLELICHTGNLRHGASKPDYVSVVWDDEPGENRISVDRMRELLAGAQPDRNDSDPNPYALRRQYRLTG